MPKTHLMNICQNPPRTCRRKALRYEGRVARGTHVPVCAWVRGDVVKVSQRRDVARLTDAASVTARSAMMGDVVARLQNNDLPHSRHARVVRAVMACRGCAASMGVSTRSVRASTVLKSAFTAGLVAGLCGPQCKGKISRTRWTKRS